MVPTPSVAGHVSSLDSQLNHDHATFQNPEVVPVHLRDFTQKPPMTDPVVVNLVQKQNPHPPGMAGSR